MNKLRVIFALLTMMFPFSSRGAGLPSDERVVFFPTCAWLDEAAGVWRVPIHAWVYEPEEDSLRRKAALGLFRRGLGLESDAEETELFRRRARLFLVDNKRDHTLQIRLGGKVYNLTPTGANGQSQTTLALTPAEAGTLLAAHDATDRWVRFTLDLPSGDKREFAGAVQLVPAAGWSVISDVDDTIKVSEVRDKRALLRNTFLREYAAAPGMSDAYRRHAEAGAVFHYVSASPWQLFTPLDEFRDGAKFPRGSFHMKAFRAKDATALNLLASPDDLKPAAIEPLLAAYPRRRFVLIGDSGERDPEIYGALARKFPEQVVRISIRNVSDEATDAMRFREAFRDLPTERWHVFTDPADVQPPGS